MSFTQHAKFVLEDKKGKIIIGLILILNGIVLGLETIPGMISPYKTEFLNIVFVLFFSLEMLIRYLANPKNFFKKGWDVFDTLIIVFSWISLFNPHFLFFKAVRILRLVRIIELVPYLNYLVSSLKNAVSGVLHASSILVLLFYVFSVMGVQFFGIHQPEKFGNLSKSMYTLFALMIEEGFVEVTEKCMETHPYALFFFIPFILCTTFTVLNLFLGVIINSMNKALKNDE